MGNTNSELVMAISDLQSALTRLSRAVERDLQARIGQSYAEAPYDPAYQDKVLRRLRRIDTKSKTYWHYTSRVLPLNSPPRRKAAFQQLVEDGRVVVQGSLCAIPQLIEGEQPTT
jgi:hypothetical protein